MSDCSCDFGETVPWTEFLPYILPSAGDVPDVIAAHMARLAAIEYAIVTKELKASIGIKAQRGACYFRLCTSDDYTVESIDYVDVGGRELQVNRQTHGFGRSGEFTFDQSEGRLIIPGGSPCDGMIEVRATVLPGQDSCFVNRMVYARHAETITHGALMRLYRMRSEKWYDPTLAREEERLFRDALRWARVNSLKGGSSKPLVMTAPRVI